MVVRAYAHAHTQTHCQYVHEVHVVMQQQFIARQHPRLGCGAGCVVRVRVRTRVCTQRGLVLAANHMSRHTCVYVCTRMHAIHRRKRELERQGTGSDRPCVRQQHAAGSRQQAAGSRHARTTFNFKLGQRSAARSDACCARALTPGTPPRAALASLAPLGSATDACDCGIASATLLWLLRCECECEYDIASASATLPVRVRVRVRLRVTATL